jgi:hypothetical protein
MTELNDKAIAILQQQDTETFSKKRSKVRLMLDDAPMKEIIDGYMELLTEVNQWRSREIRQQVEITKIPITQQQFDQMFRIIGTDGRGRRVGSKNGVRKDAE